MRTFLGVITTQRLHLWCGLFAAIWLSVLGITGFILDHRDSWRWMWQSGINDSFVSDVVSTKAKGASRLYQVSPHDPTTQLSGGLNGLWWKSANQKEWSASVSTVPMPLIYQVLFDRQHKGKVWLATDDGLWYSDNNGKSIAPYEFKGEPVTSITKNSKSELYVVIDRSYLYKLSITADAVTEIKLQPPSDLVLPPAITLSRFVRDLHYGRGVFTVDSSLLWNDITGIALLLIPLTGFMFYWLPRRWRRRKAEGVPVSHVYKRQAIRWLFRMHGPILGLACFLPILYLSITGIFLDHSKGLREWMKQTKVTRTFQTPVYNLSSWQGHIYGLAVSYNGDIISLATRLGLFSSANGGQNWSYEKLWRDQAVFVWTLRQFGEQVYVGGMGSPNFMKTGSDCCWQKIKGHAHMPSDITFDINGMLLKNRKGLWQLNQNNKLIKVKRDFPVQDFVPWFYVLDGLHSGMLIHEQWKWVNDLFAILAIILVITGLMRWWRTRWI